jgi:hypothetical protein
MVKIARRRFQVEDGQKARFFEVGDEVPDEFEGRYDPVLVEDSNGPKVERSDPEGVNVGESGGSAELSPDALAEFEQLKTIEQITTWVRMGGSEADARARHALAVEQGGGQRKGLVEALEAHLAGEQAAG